MPAHSHFPVSQDSDSDASSEDSDSSGDDRTEDEFSMLAHSWVRRHLRLLQQSGLSFGLTTVLA